MGPRPLPRAVPARLDARRRRAGRDPRDRHLLVEGRRAVRRRARGARARARCRGRLRDRAVPHLPRLRDRLLALLHRRHRRRRGAAGALGPGQGRGQRRDRRPRRHHQPPPRRRHRPPAVAVAPRSATWASRCCARSRPTSTRPECSTRGCWSREHPGRALLHVPGQPRLRGRRGARGRGAGRPAAARGGRLGRRDLLAGPAGHRRPRAGRRRARRRRGLGGRRRHALPPRRCGLDRRRGAGGAAGRARQRLRADAGAVLRAGRGRRAPAARPGARGRPAGLDPARRAEPAGGRLRLLRHRRPCGRDGRPDALDPAEAAVPAGRGPRDRDVPPRPVPGGGRRRGARVRRRRWSWWPVPPTTARA